MRDGPICLYSAVSDDALFERVGFYRDDLAALATRSSDVRPIRRFSDIWRLRPSVLVGYFYSASLVAALIGRLVGARVVLTGGADQVSPVLKHGLRLVAHRFLAFLCLCFAHKVVLSCGDDFREFRRIAVGQRRLIRKISLAPHVVRPSAGAAIAKRQVVGEFHAFTICWLGSVENVSRKGVDRAVRLIAALRSIGVDATLDIAGTPGTGLSFLELLVEQLDLRSSVRFLGAISEEAKNGRFSRGAVYLQLSEYEGFGVAAAEAFLSGMIVVHTNRGGLREVIGHAGMVVDIDELLRGGAEALRQFYRSYLDFPVDHEAIAVQTQLYSIDARARNLLE